MWWTVWILAGDFVYKSSSYWICLTTALRATWAVGLLSASFSVSRLGSDDPADAVEVWGLLLAGYGRWSSEMFPDKATSMGLDAWEYSILDVIGTGAFCRWRLWFHMCKLEQHVISLLDASVFYEGANNIEFHGHQCSSNELSIIAVITLHAENIRPRWLSWTPSLSMDVHCENVGKSQR